MHLLIPVLIAGFFLWPDGGGSVNQKTKGSPRTFQVGTPSPEPAIRNTLPRQQPDPTASPRAQQTPPPTTSKALPVPAPEPRSLDSQSAASVYIQGDSLSQDIGPRLKGLLPGWGVKLDALSGRHFQTGLERIRKIRLPQVVVFALGTNDWDYPASWHKSQLEKVISQVGPRRCLVIASVWADGASRSSFNTPLTVLAKRYGPRRMQIMPWSEAVAAGQVKLVDGTHPADWKLRARQTADAIKRCTSD